MGCDLIRFVGPFPLRFLLNSSLRLKRPDMLEHSHALCRKLTSESDEKHLIPAFCSVSDRQKTVLRTSSLNRSPCLKYDEQSSNRLEPRHRTARCHTTDMQDV